MEINGQKAEQRVLSESAKRKKIAVSTLTLILFSLSATVNCVSAADIPNHVRIGSGTGDGSAQALYAQRTGRFKNVGLEVDLDMNVNDVGRYEGIDSGSIDIAFSNIVSIVTAIEKGKSYILLTPGAIYTTKSPMTVLVQAPSSNYRTGADLIGKIVATPSANDLGQLGVMAWVDRHGGDSHMVTFVHGMPMAKISAALAEHQFDAAELTEPEWTLQRKQGTVKLLAHNFDAIADRFANGAFFARKEWVEAHREVVIRFITAMSQTARWANVHHAETAPMLAAESKLPPSLTSSMVRATYAEKMTPNLIQPPLDVAARYGMISPIKARDIIFIR